ncbi:hypothetical protein HU200_002542 [Digitaria exilis]|uniref:Uncharacterized protein n=1 Tax=Digitaria exilis TaxID=1010633 RepID=A0A835FXZ1_9POAL|nr:hypothetical protein HU200_002542 [Digitaria exilis]
MMKARVNQNP